MTDADRCEGPIAGLTGAVLAGGEARRMGRVNKALVHVGGRPVLDHILDRLRETCAHVMVIANTAQPYAAQAVRVYPDVLPGHGALGGLYSALCHAPTEHVFVCACDMPFISSALIRHLARRIAAADAAVPRDETRLQPLHAVYARRLAPLLRPVLERGDLKIENFIRTLSARVLPFPEVAPFMRAADVFFNVNTPQDLERARSQVGD